MSLPPMRIEPAVGSISRSTVRPTVDLPHPDSPTSPSVSPLRIVKLTPSTAYTAPPARCRKPLRTGKCFFKSRTSRTASASGIAASVEFVRAPAGRPMSRPFLLVRRIGGTAARLRMRAARREDAALRQIDQRRNGAGNLLQAVDRFRLLAAHQRQPRDGGHEAVRIGMLRPREQLLDRRFLHLAARVH